MRVIFDNIWRIVLYGFAMGLVAWTGYHTYQMLYYTDPQPNNTALAMYGLIIFEGGMLLWFQLFQRDAKSILQHAISLLGTVVGFLLVMTAFSMYWFTPLDALRSAQPTAKWIIIVATILNVLFYLIYELAEPNMWERIQESIHVATVLFKADQKAGQMVDAQSEQLAQELANQRKDRAFAEARSRNLAPQKQIPQQGGGNFGGGQRPPMGAPPMGAKSFASEATKHDDKAPN